MSTVQVDRPGLVNLLVNPGFELKNRPAASFATNGAKILDGWELGVGTSTLAVTQTAGFINPGGQGVRLNYTHVAGGFGHIFQKLEPADVPQLLGRWVTFAATVKSSTVGSVQLMVGPSASPSYGGVNATTGAERHVVSAFLPAGAADCRVWVMGVATGLIDVDDCTLAVGRAPLDYYPLHPAEELRRTERRYERQIGPVAGALLTQTYAFSGSGWVGTWMTFATRKGGVPTMTKNGTWAVNNCQQPGCYNQNPDGYVLAAAPTVANVPAWFHVADGTCSIEAEWNP